MIVTALPDRAQAWAISQPTTPPPRTSRLLGHLVRRRDLAIGPGRDVGEALDRGHRGARCRSRGRPPARAVSVAPVDLDRALARSSRASPRISSIPRSSSQGSCTGVVEVVDHLVAPSSIEPHVELAARRPRPRPGTRSTSAQQLGRAEQRLRGHAGVERALAADQLALDQGRRRARRRRAGRRRPRRRGRRRSRRRRARSSALTVASRARSRARGRGARLRLGLGASSSRTLCPPIVLPTTATASCQVTPTTVVAVAPEMTANRISPPLTIAWLRTGSSST